MPVIIITYLAKQRLNTHMLRIQQYHIKKNITSKINISVQWQALTLPMKIETTSAHVTQ